MKTRFIPFITFITFAFLMVVFSCKPKPIEKPEMGENTISAPAENVINSKSKVSEVAKITTDSERMVGTTEQVDVNYPNAPSFKKLDKELMDSLALIPPPKNREEYNAINVIFLKTLERKKQLLLSIPVTPQALKDYEQAWKTLEITSFFDTQQDHYVRDLILKYSDAPQLERLVFWRLIRLRMESGIKRGSATGEELLKVELARFLLTALGIDKHDQFEEMRLVTRSASEEAGRKGNQAEEEIARIYSEQSEKAETILENHFKQSP